MHSICTVVHGTTFPCGKNLEGCVLLEGDRKAGWRSMYALQSPHSCEPLSLRSRPTPSAHLLMPLNNY